MARTQQNNLHIRARFPKPGTRVDQSHRIHPIPHAPGPQDHSIFGSNARDDTAQNRTLMLWSFRRKTKGNNRQEALEKRIILVVGAIQTTGCRQHPQPEMSLRLARAEKEIPVDQMVLQPAQCEQGPPSASIEIGPEEVEI